VRQNRLQHNSPRRNWHTSKAQNPGLAKQNSFTGNPEGKEFKKASQNFGHRAAVYDLSPKLYSKKLTLISTLRAHQEPVSGQACNPHYPHWSLAFLLVKGFYGTRYQSGSFSFINVGTPGSGFSLPALFFCLVNTTQSCKECKFPEDRNICTFTLTKISLKT